MKTIITIIIVSLLFIASIAFSKSAFYIFTQKSGENSFFLQKMSRKITSGGALPEEGFFLLESSGDKLLLESGVTDALLLEG